MRALLMFADRDFHVDADLLEAVEFPYRRRHLPEPVLPVGERELIDDLELEDLWDAMAGDDSLIYVSARSALLAGLDSAEKIHYRQAVLRDCMTNPEVVREIYTVAVEAVIAEREVWRSASTRRAETLVRYSVTVLERLIPALRRLRAISEEHAGQFRSEGFRRFFDGLQRELDDDYFAELADHLRQLRFRDGVLMSARLGERSQGVGYVLRVPSPGGRGRFHFHRVAMGKPTYDYVVSPRDFAGAQALGRLSDRGLTLVANALGQSTDHIVDFFISLRSELAFYVGCLNAYDQLCTKGEPTCLPEPYPHAARMFSAQALYEPCLSLRTLQWVQGNDLRADGKSLIVITGTNQGGKSTFLRALGIAQLMMQAGMFVCAESFAGSLTSAVFTHYKREEDATMTQGKFDEELARMSRLVEVIRPGSLLICNESFAATNEREGSEIAYEFLRAMDHLGVRVVFVTHLYELAHRCLERDADRTLFLRAERGVDGRRPFLLVEAPPLPTSYGEDLYWRTFGEPEEEVRA